MNSPISPLVSSFDAESDEDEDKEDSSSESELEPLQSLTIKQ